MTVSMESINKKYNLLQMKVVLQGMPDVHEVLKQASII